MSPISVPLVREFMVKEVLTLKAETDIFQAIDFLLKNKISGAPVVDQEKHIVGMLSEKDCLRVFASGSMHQLSAGKVADYMSRKVLTVRPEDDVFQVAGIFLKNAFRRLPVVDDGILVGQISRRDVLNQSRKIFEMSPVKKEWTDSRYLSDEIKAALADHRPGA